MNSGSLALTLWSDGLAGFAYAVFAMRLANLAYWRSPRELSKVALLLAVIATALWGSLRLLSLWLGQPFCFCSALAPTSCAMHAGSLFC